ncbi:MAG TPA: hypothetical protein VLB44_04005 [Kofleriaceae bacterium]|nr:hypothetical protein [Kofleriaceae bacterium]
MVKTSLLALLVLTAVADAHPPPPPDDEYRQPPAETTESIADDSPAFNMLGIRFAFGALPIRHADTLTMSVGLGVEHPVFKKTRVFGEYEWLWLITRPDERDLMSTTPRPERHGSGHRAMLGLRRELVGKGRHAVHAFVDGELGAGLALTNDNIGGVAMLPTLFGGLRAGYDMYSRTDDSPSRTFEVEILVRAVAVPDGIGMLGGVGMAWGN